MESANLVVPVESKNFDHLRIIHDDDEVKMKSVADVKNVLSYISFAPSCVDMGWLWEVERVYVKQFDDVKMEEEFIQVGYRLRTTFKRPDRNTGNVDTGVGRWWEIGANCTESAVVKTAYAAAEMILKHELMESFKWRGSRPFDPHHTIQELASIQGTRYTMSIP